MLEGKSTVETLDFFKSVFFRELKSKFADFLAEGLGEILVALTEISTVELDTLPFWFLVCVLEDDTAEVVLDGAFAFGGGVFAVVELYPYTSLLLRMVGW